MQSEIDRSNIQPVRSLNMKKFISLGLLALASYSISLGQKTNNIRHQASTVEQTILRMEREQLDACVKGDTRNLERYLAEDYVETTPNGQTMTKKRTLEVYKPGVYESGVSSALKLRVYGVTAVVNGVYLVKFKSRDAI
jgi:hypothetical protein